MKYSLHLLVVTILQYFEISEYPIKLKTYRQITCLASIIIARTLNLQIYPEYSFFYKETS